MNETDINKYHTHISSERKALELNLKEVWQYRDLIVLFTKRTFQLTYKQTILGPLWIFLNPFMTSLIYTFVFAGIAGMSTDGVPQLLFYLCGNAAWGFFSSSVTTNAKTFTANANMFGKVYFPRLTVPVSNVLSAAVQFAIQMILVTVFLIYYCAKGRVQPHWETWPLIFIVLLQLGMLGLGCGIIVSSLTTKYRDLTVLVTFGVSLWMYATPVVYPLSQLGDSRFKLLLMINPVTEPLEMFRYAVLGQGTVIPLYVGISWIVTIIVIIVGILIFNRVEKTFMDTV